jgi:phage tail-like protein
MADRNVPYGAFNYIVSFNNEEIFGGFSDVSGIGTEIKIAEYRNGNEVENHVRKVPGTHTVADTTLKRGIVKSDDVWEWIKETRTLGPAAQRTVTIQLLDEARAPVQTWVLRGVVPSKYTGPTLAGKGGGDVAMEELVLSAQAIEIEVNA